MKTQSYFYIVILFFFVISFYFYTMSTSKTQKKLFSKEFLEIKFSPREITTFENLTAYKCYDFLDLTDICIYSNICLGNNYKLLFLTNSTRDLNFIIRSDNIIHYAYHFNKLVDSKSFKHRRLPYRSFTTA